MPVDGGKRPKGKRGGLSALQDRFRSKLEGAKFRMLNEQLYTTRGEEAFRSFSREPGLFDIYHRGFREQVEKWPVNPLHRIIQWIKAGHAKAVVADLGCGDAELADSLPNTVHSFDLVSRRPHVTACDMARLPLPASSVDIAVFCLSLMGTNLADYLGEAHRILRKKPAGILKVAEVRSRFDGEPGGLDRFVESIESIGFKLTSQDKKSKMFVMMEFRVLPQRSQDPVDVVAKPCLYKRR
uniref:Ribosomal RNA-processing protein 8 n=1 Tax=Rhizochromulina marina TaxID=1034831 RepID=A0A7S2SF88_9STRA